MARHLNLEGQKKPTQEPYSNSSYLNSANDWQVKVDLRGKLKIPSSVTITDIRHYRTDCPN